MRLLRNLAIWAFVVGAVLAGIYWLQRAPMDLDADRAAQFLQHNDAALDDLSVTAADCGPVNDRGVAMPMSVEPDGLATRCASDHPGAADKLRAALKRLNLRSVATSGPSSAAADGRDVEIRLANVGLAPSGHTTSLIHYAQPQTEAQQIERGADGAVLREARALTPPPYHWFWERQN